MLFFMIIINFKRKFSLCTKIEYDSKLIKGFKVRRSVWDVSCIFLLPIYLFYFEYGNCGFRRSRLRNYLQTAWLVAQSDSNNKRMLSKPFLVRGRSYRSTIRASHFAWNILPCLRYHVLLQPSLQCRSNVPSSHEQQVWSSFRKIITSQVMTTRLAKGGRPNKQINFQSNRLSLTSYLEFHITMTCNNGVLNTLYLLCLWMN